MTRIQRLLAATDLSAPARHAAERAALVARELGASLELLHVISVAPVDRLRRLLAEASADLESQVAADALTEVRRLSESLQQQYQVQPTTHVEHGALLRQIEARADASAADVLVLGARGASFMRHLLLGSTAERLVRRASRPMLVVKQPPRDPYRRLLIPVDFSPASLPACACALALAPRAEFVLLHAFEVPFEARLRSAGVQDETLRRYREIAHSQADRAMHAFLAAAGLQSAAVNALVLHGDASSLIVEQEQERDCDLVVIGKHGESMVDDFLLGSVTKHVLQEAQGDVLVSV
jgi:nucleotide-binding universal stress UspA family protein